MTQYNTDNVKLSISQLKRLKSSAKNATDVTLRLSSNIIGDYKTNFPHRILLTDRQVASIRKTFAKKSSEKLQNHKNTENFEIKAIRNETIWSIPWYTFWTLNKRSFVVDKKSNVAVRQKCADTTRNNSNRVSSRCRNLLKNPQKYLQNI